MKASIFVGALLLSFFGCASPPGDQLTQQQKDQFKSDIKAVCDSITARVARADAGWFDYFSDSPDWGMVNADGSRWDYQTTRKFVRDWAGAVTSCRWTTARQNFIFMTKDIVICAWDGKDETFLKSGERITIDPHAYTMVFKRIAGQWKAIYSHDSGIPVTAKAGQQ